MRQKIWKPTDDIKVVVTENAGENWFYKNYPIANVMSHCHFRLPRQEKGMIFSPQEILINDKVMSVKVSCSFGEYECTNSLEDGFIRTSISFEFARDWHGGADFCLFQRPAHLTRCRLYDMMVSGWSDSEHGIIFQPEFSGEAKLTFVHYDDGAVQFLGLSCPAGIQLGERKFMWGQRISGSMKMTIGELDVYDPDVAGPMKPRSVASGPARSYQEYIKLWHDFTKRPGLWFDLDEEKTMGMFHRGWFNFLKGEKQYSGVLYLPRDYQETGVNTWTEPLIELAWGGGANLAVMETLFRLKDKRALKILKALLYFKNGGFMHENGSWINAYQPVKDEFSDRYGRAHSEVATGGTVNLFLWRCLKNSWIPDEEKVVVTQKIQRFCDDFLQQLKTPAGGTAFSRFWDGSPGAQREWITYPEECYPISDAFAAFSYMIAYLLTKKAKYKSCFLDSLEHLVDRHLTLNEWRFMEYDTLGADAVAPSWILLILDEIIDHENLLSPSLQKKVRDQYHRTYRVLHSFLREREDYENAEWKAATFFGCKTITQGGIIHGSTPNSTQGAHSVHLRYDFPLAMGAYTRRTGNPVALVDWESYLNWATWQQYTDPRWPDVIGSSTEHVTFRQGYIQDTAQIKHGNPIAMLEFLEYS